MTITCLIKFGRERRVVRGEFVRETAEQIEMLRDGALHVVLKRTLICEPKISE